MKHLMMSDGEYDRYKERWIDDRIQELMKVVSFDLFEAISYLSYKKGELKVHNICNNADVFEPIHKTDTLGHYIEIAMNKALRGQPPESWLVEAAVRLHVESEKLFEKEHGIADWKVRV